MSRYGRNLWFVAGVTAYVWLVDVGGLMLLTRILHR